MLSLNVNQTERGTAGNTFQTTTVVSAWDEPRAGPWGRVSPSPVTSRNPLNRDQKAAAFGIQSPVARRTVWQHMCQWILFSGTSASHLVDTVFQVSPCFTDMRKCIKVEKQSH